MAYTGPPARWERMMKNGFWVFGYGSLLWNPGFVPEQSHRAVLTGFRRSFCMWSIHHRGTPSQPGLVLALDRAERGSCEGMALKVAGRDAELTLQELRRRELVSSAYHEETIRIRIAGVGEVEAVAYIVDRNHRQYCRLRPEEQARIIASASGGRGDNRDYLERTVARLNELGIGDPDLDSLLGRVHAITAGAGHGRSELCPHDPPQ